jgi:hypothetical protein
MTTITRERTTSDVQRRTESGVHDRFGQLAPVDPKIAYPSYRSFDEFIDTERLRSLDGYITQRIFAHMRDHEDLRFYTGPYLLESGESDRPGSKMIYLSSSKLPDSYFDLDKTELWQRTENADEFASLIDFIATLPFEATGRMLIMYDVDSCKVPAHRDHLETEICHEFIWFRPNLKKRFYMLNHDTGERCYITSYSAWFDTVNQYHGCDSREGLTYSIRVDGKFTKDFRRKIPRPQYNSASTPSYWSALEIE